MKKAKSEVILLAQSYSQESGIAPDILILSQEKFVSTQM
jgi:hypothetical protein